MLGMRMNKPEVTDLSYCYLKIKLFDVRILFVYDQSEGYVRLKIEKDLSSAMFKWRTSESS